MTMISTNNIIVFGFTSLIWITYFKFFGTKNKRVKFLDDIEESKSTINLPMSTIALPNILQRLGISSAAPIDVQGPLLKSTSAMNLLDPPVKILNGITTNSDAIVIGVAGGSGSGKTTLARAIVEALGADSISYVSHDSYYKDLSHLTMAEREQTNFDHPHSLDTDLLVQHIKLLKQGKSVRVPRYDYKTHSRIEGLVELTPKRIILVEGILILSDPALTAEMSIKVYVDTDDDVRLIRRIQRDVVERKRTLQSIIEQYLKTVRPMHIEFVQPSRHNADIIIPVGINSVALDLLVTRLKLFVDPANNDGSIEIESPVY